MVSQNEVKFHSDPTMTCVMASRHVGRTALYRRGFNGDPGTANMKSDDKEALYCVIFPDMSYKAWSGYFI